MRAIATRAAATPSNDVRRRAERPRARRSSTRTITRAGFDPNDPLTWNATEADVDESDFVSDTSGVTDVAVSVDVQTMSDADLATMLGVAGAASPTMLDDEALLALRASEAEEAKRANDCASCIAEGQRLYSSGKYEEALATFERAGTLPGSGPVRYRKSVVAPAGPSAGFKPRELSSGEEIAIAYNKACCHANIGNVEEGLASLLTALERGYDQYPAIRADADIASLREDSRFEVIMARFEPQSTLGKLFDAFNGPKKGVSMLDGIKNIFEK